MHNEHQSFVVLCFTRPGPHSRKLSIAGNHMAPLPGTRLEQNQRKTAEGQEACRVPCAQKDVRAGEESHPRPPDTCCGRRGQPRHRCQSGAAPLTQERRCGQLWKSTKISKERSSVQRGGLPRSPVPSNVFPGDSHPRSGCLRYQSLSRALTLQTPPPPPHRQGSHDSQCRHRRGESSSDHRLRWERTLMLLPHSRGSFYCTHQSQRRCEQEIAAEKEAYLRKWHQARRHRWASALKA